MKKLGFGILALAMLLTGCTNSGKVAMKVGDVEVKDEYIRYFEDAFNGGAGGTVSEEVAGSAKKTAQMYAEFGALGHAMKLDVEEEYNKLIAEITASMGSVEEIQKNLKISNELFEFVMYGDAYRNVLVEQCKADSGITEEATDVYFKENYWRAKHLLLTTDGKTEEEQKKIKAQAEDLYKQIKNGADFDKLISEYNEDPGVQSNPDGYVFTKNEMVNEFEEGVSSIEIGEYNLVKTSYGYHIVKRLALDETPEKYEEYKAQVSEKIEQALVSDLFDKFIEDKIKEYDIETIDYTIDK